MQTARQTYRHERTGADPVTLPPSVVWNLDWDPEADENGVRPVSYGTFGGGAFRFEPVTDTQELSFVLQPTVANDILPSHRQSVETRLRMLKRLPANHDGCGAAAAIADTVDAATLFLRRIDTVMWYNATLNDDGEAVIEFDDADTGKSAEVTFSASEKGRVEVYFHQLNQPSRILAGDLESAEIKALLCEAGVIA